MSTPPTIEVHNVGAGIVLDRPAHELPPEIWTNGKNFRFKNTNAVRFLGHEEALGAQSATPQAIFNVPAINDQTFWFVFDLDKVYVWESGVESEVTNTGGDYNTANGWEWIGTVFAGTPIWTNNIDPPQWWPAVSVSQELEDLTDFPANTIAKVIRAFGSYLIALNLTESGTNRPHKVLVSAKADPGSVPEWDVNDATKDAVSFELTDAKGGEILDGRPLGSRFIVYKKNSTHVMRYIGGQEIWARDLVYENSGVLATRCVCVANKGTQHFVVTQNDIVLHSATGEAPESLVEERVRESIFAELDPDSYVSAFVFENEREKELWFAYPTVGSATPNKAFVYNYRNKTTGFRDFDGLSADSGVVTSSEAGDWASASGDWDSDVEPWSNAQREVILFASPGEGAVFQLDKGYAFGSQTPLAFLERTGLAVTSKDRQGNPKADFKNRYLCTRVRPKIRGTGVWSVQVGAAETLNGDVIWAPAVSFNPQTDIWADPEVPPSGVLMAIRFEQQQNAAGQVEGYDLWLGRLGEY